MTSIFSMGSDPEFILTDEQGSFCSAVEIVPADSENRISKNGHTFYHDNVLAECGIRPASGKEAVLDSFQECFKLYAELVSPYRLQARASATYGDDQLRTMAARTVGCRPESCAYTMDFLPSAAEAIETTGFRSAGGHVHLGVDNPEIWQHENTAHYAPKMLDLFLGIPCMFMDHDPTSKARKALYGTAGSHRRQNYGVEYRTLSNFWLASPILVGLVHDICEFVVQFVNDKRYLEFWTENADAIANYEEVDKCFSCHGYDVQKLRTAINTGDKRRARQFMTMVGQYLPPKLMTAINEASRPRKYDMYKEWGL